MCEAFDQRPPTKIHIFRRVIARNPLPTLGEKFLHISPRGHRGLRSFAGDRDGRCRRGKSCRCPWVIAFKQRHGKCAVEAVARGYRVDGLYGERPYPRSLAGDGDIRAITAAFEHNTLEALRQYVLRSRFGVWLTTEIKRSLSFVWSEPGNLAKGGVRERSGWGGIEHHRHTCTSAEREHMAHCFQSQVQSAEDHAGCTAREGVQ